ncbi:FAD-dependent monooxygenase [Nocardia farcinica]|uniref:FAD-dependent monooxygenase n=1 Tax=Nocardia farcinica TaxID=37329 RepID=UPI0015F0928E|nr:FAD-dependent monooxygenase [Nocardia farcinica]MBA4856270.1 FAD-dependent monooxygenase [Nocardia farcinica]MBC9814091.1 FAD-dependent monooxygenase [Nocardia farcinica]
MDRTGVVIAGGGPVGLWLAAELRLGGVPVTVVEARDRRDERSKALTVHPRTIEILASRGVHGPFLAEGVPIRGGHFGVLDTRLDFGVLDSPFPYTLALPQARTEELLEERARALGARILRGHRVVGFTEEADRVTVAIEGPAGPARIEAAYLAGCDGTRSTVRAAAGIGFPGTPATLAGWLGDVVLDNPPEGGFGHFGPEGTLLVVALPGGLHRIVGLTPQDVTTEWPGEFTLAELRAKTVTLAGHDFGMRAPVWLSRYGNATHLADHYRRGRVVLAGDAAHQHFPAGGVGMNVGIQDAHNLGWKLAATLTGRARPELLDTYETERRPVGAELTDTSRAQVALMSVFSPEGLRLRALLAEMLANNPQLNKDLAERVSGLAVRYRPAPDAHPLTGTRAPDLRFGATGLFELLHGGEHVLLDLTGAGDPGSRPGLLAHTARPEHLPGDWSGVGAALIRPDGHIAWAAATLDHRSIDAVLTGAHL